jgi:hypothetical protein
MDMYPKYTSPFGYQIGTGGIDTYGVDHSGFTTRDELQYQIARQKRENQLKEQYNAQGITENYPQYTTNFWGNSANNYGFGMTNIANNIANMQNNFSPIPVATAAPQMTTQPITSQVQQQSNTSAWDNVKKAANNFADATEAFSVGFTNGLTLGNFDEMMGAATAAITANPNNYQMGRDAVRQLNNNLVQRNPYIYGGAEFVGAMNTPMHFAKDTSFTNKAINAATDTLNASAGYAENWNDFGTNLAVNGIANTLGLPIDKIPYTRGVSIVGRKFIKQGINSIADKLKNIYYVGKNER